jgi:hypothetical protein
VKKPQFFSTYKADHTILFFRKSNVLSFIATDREQPICFTTACSARTVTQATPEMLAMAAKILKFNGERPLLMADNEHYTVELLDWISATSPYDLSVPMLKLV